MLRQHRGADDKVEEANTSKRPSHEYSINSLLHELSLVDSQTCAHTCGAVFGIKYDAGENGGVRRASGLLREHAGDATVVFATSAAGWRIILAGDVREAQGWFQSFLDYLIPA